jgi:Uma2 family endonuclease
VTTAAAERRLTFEEFLEFEAQADRKHEYVAGYVYDLAGALRPHNLIAAAILGGLVGPARARGCQALGSDQLVKVTTEVGEIGYYPDVQVVCDPTDRNPRYSERPCIIVEVLSEHTKRTDRGEKLQAYRRIPTLESYLIVSQEQRRVERHWRQDDEWHLELIINDGVVPFPCVGVELSLDDIYGQAL